jgi:hypothetical protein
MHEINLVDHSFDLKRTSEYHISIQLGLDGFSFCILDIPRNKYILFRHIPLIVGKLQFLPQKIENIFEEEDKLNNSFNSVSITYSGINATLFPKEFSNASESFKFASLSNGTSRIEEIKTEDIPGFSYQIVYSLPNKLMNLFNRRYSEFQFRHKSIPLLGAAMEQRNEKKNSLVINFEKKYIRAVAIKGSQIDLYNSFYFKNESDFLFHILNIWRNLQLDPEKDEALIGGFVADDSIYVRQIKKYIGNVSFLKPSEEYNYGTLFEKVQKHQFVSLLNTYRCV